MHTCTLVPWGILQKLLKFAGSDILVFQNKWPEMTFWGSSLCIWQELPPSQDLMNTRKLMGREEELSMVCEKLVRHPGGPLSSCFSFRCFPPPFITSFPLLLFTSPGKESERGPEQRGTGPLGSSPKEEVWRHRSPVLPCRL